MGEVTHDAWTVARRQVLRQLMHWQLAVDSLSNLEHSAAPTAWSALERHLGLSLRRNIGESVEQLRREVEVVVARFRAVRSMADLDRVGHELIRFRRRYMQTETLVDFFGDAVNSRTNPTFCSMLRAFDFIAESSMEPVMKRLGYEVPPVLTYTDKGLGASILKAGLRLWDGGTVSAVAAIKVTFHNRRRPTALLHEVGHQVAHITQWNGELAEALQRGLAPAGGAVASEWALWASEVAADAYAFVNAGYASVAALADVISGTPGEVFRHTPGDPHPISYLRVLLGIECCRRVYGRGPWDELHDAWTTRYPADSAPGDVRQLIVGSLPHLAKIAEISLLKSARAFKGVALADVVSPERVSPQALAQLAAQHGQRLYSSPVIARKEAIRIVALTGLRFATEPERFHEIVREHDQAVGILGGAATEAVLAVA